MPVRVKRAHQKQESRASRFEDLEAVPKGSTPAEMAAFLPSETDRWGPVIRDAQIKVEN
jgi:tripartite-type tricarboxylate transporter receptor subunit TctC